MNIQDRLPQPLAPLDLLAPSWRNPPADFIQQLPMAIYACDTAGRVLWFNAKAADLWGRSPCIGDDSELYCGSYKLYLDGHSVRRDETPMAEVIRTGIALRGVEGRVERPDGSHVWAIVHIEPIFDEAGDVAGAISCFHKHVTGGRPPTSETGRDDLVRARDERLAATYEHVEAGIVEIDGGGRMLRVNQKLCDLMGHPAGELLGRTIFDETLPEDVNSDIEQFRRQVAGEIDRYTIEKRILRKNGEYFWAEVSSSSVRDARGAFLYAVRVQHDITARKNAEEELARRSEEQAALFQFSERLQRVASLDDIYPAALDAVTRALDCERAAILLYDVSGLMRFVAWRGLSDAYRQAVEGHSPWTPDDKNPQPVYFENIAASNLSEELKTIIARERIGAVAFIPIVIDGALAGKFMGYYDGVHRFVEAEVEVALTLARQLGFGIARLKAEDARQVAEKSAQQLVAIVESSQDAIISKDLDGIIRTWNEGAKRLFGYTAEEAVGQPITLLFPDGRHDEEPGILARIRRGERIQSYETVRKCKDGTLVDISLTVSPLRDRAGRVVGASKIARDISDRKEAERKLLESELHLKELLAAIPAAIYTTDAAGKITYFNEAAVKFSGRTPQLGTDEWCVTWKLFKPDGTPLPHHECPMAVALKEGRPIRNAEAVAERPDGTRVPFIPFPTPLRDSLGNVIGAINMLVDISERRQAETQQRLLLDELNHRTKNNMQMLQSLLFAAARTAQSDEARKVLNDVSNRIAAMAAAQHVLYGKTDTSRFAAGEFLNAVCKTVQQIMPAGVLLDCQPTTGVLSNDAAMPLALIVNELVTNAVKYGAKDRKSGSVRVSLAEVDGQRELCVEDDGEGFDLESVRNRSSGLQLVLGLARQLNGTLRVTSHPSRVTLRFPSEKAG